MKIIDYSAKAIAVIGDTKPIKDELKKLGGKFNPKLSCGAGWIFSAKKRADVEKLVAGDHTVIRTKNAVQNDKEMLDEYLAECGKFAKGSYLSYFKEKFSYAIRLTNGGILSFDKPRIETSFCFGYHLSRYDTKDFDNANKMAEYASKNEDYFLTRNLESFDRTIKLIETGRDEYNLFDVKMYLSNARKDEETNLWILHIYTTYSTAERQVEYWENEGIKYEAVNDTDKAAILAAYKHERNKFEKRLKTYLKRYGTSKLKTWSYWRDA